MARKEGNDRWLLLILAVALFLKLVAALGRMFLNILLYGGLYDAGRYHEAGVKIAEDIWHLNLGPVFHHLQFRGSWGTLFTEFYSGLVHTLTGPTVSGAYMVFGLLAFVGAFFMYRAFRVAFPQGRRYLYALLVFLYPGVLFWSNGIGKDALMLLFIGVASYGGALLLVRTHFSGIMPLTIGLLGTATVRPHVTGMLVIAMLGAFLLRRSRGSGHKGIFLQGTLLVAGLGMVWLFTPKVMHYVGLQELSAEGAVDYFATRQVQTLRGGSSFEPPSFTDPLFLPKAVITILYRPYPWEAHNMQALIQAMDGMILLGLTFWRGPALVRAVLGARSNPYVIFILAYMAIMAASFMTIANFGTLARERAMLLPLFLMLLAAVPSGKKKEPEAAVSATAGGT